MFAQCVRCFEGVVRLPKWPLSRRPICVVSSWANGRAIRCAATILWLAWPSSTARQWAESVEPIACIGRTSCRRVTMFGYRQRANKANSNSKASRR